MKKKKASVNVMASVRKQQILDGAFDGRFVQKTVGDKKKKIKNGYIKHKKDWSL